MKFRINPQRYFIWNEPEAFRVALKKLAGWWIRPAIFASFTGCFLLSAYLKTLVPNRPTLSWQLDLILSIFGGVLMGYVLPWMNERIPSRIYVCDQYLLRIQPLRYRRFTSFSWREAPEFSVLIFHPKRGKLIFIGVPLEVSHEAVTNFLTERLPMTSATGSQGNGV